MIRKRLLFTLNILLLVFFIVPGTTYAETVLRLGHSVATVHPFHVGLTKFSELVEEKSKGQIKIEVFPTGVLGDEFIQIQDLQLGGLDLALVNSGNLSGLTDVFMVFNLPYLFPDYETSFAVLDGPAGQQILDAIRQINLVGLIYMEGGLRHISTSDKAIHSPSDIHNLRIRTMANKINIAAFKELQTVPVPMDFLELITGLKQKSIDGQEGPLTLFYAGPMGTHHKHLTLTGHMVSPSILLIGLNSWEKLNHWQQKIIKEAACEARDFQRAEMIRMENEYLEKAFQIEGVEVIRVDREHWKKIMSRGYEDFSADLNQEIVDAVSKALLKSGSKPALINRTPTDAKDANYLK